MLKTAGIVLLLKWSSLKHSFPCNLSDVLETYNENPRKEDVTLLLLSANNKDYNKNDPITCANVHLFDSPSHLCDQWLITKDNSPSEYFFLNILVISFKTMKCYIISKQVWHKRQVCLFPWSLKIWIWNLRQFLFVWSKGLWYYWCFLLITMVGILYPKWHYWSWNTRWYGGWCKGCLGLPTRQRFPSPELIQHIDLHSKISQTWVHLLHYLRRMFYLI